MKRNIALHIASLGLTKTADGLIDPKLVLAWLLNAIAAPGFLIGLLVPLREAGALLPQLLIARQVERARRRKWFWSAGAAVQGLAALGMALSVLVLPGAQAGWGVVVCLGVLAVARSVCSVSHKDVLSRSVDKGARGRVSGAAGTLSALAVFGFAGLLATGLLPREPQIIASAIAVAGGLWLVAAALYARIDEQPEESGAAPGNSLQDLVRPLARDAELRRYIATRALLVSTALGPPFMVMLGGDGTQAGGAGLELNLGLLLLASSLAAILSSYVWGALSDRSSRNTLRLAGALAAVSLGAAAICGAIWGAALAGALVAGLVFALQIAYEGARAGRKTHLTDMDTDGRKATYTALSNSLIGALLLAGGALGLLADLAGVAAVLGLLAAMSALAVVTGGTLSEVQQEG